MSEDKEEYKRFTVSIDQDSYNTLEKLRKKIGISRSEFIRKSIKSFMVSEENIPESVGNVNGCITIIMLHEHIKQLEHIQDHHQHHDHEQTHEDDHTHTHDYSSKPIYANIQQTDSLLIRDIQHHYNDVILSTLHIHLEFEKCMEIIAVSGTYDRVKSLRDNLQRLKSVSSIGFFVVDREE